MDAWRLQKLHKMRDSLAGQKMAIGTAPGGFPLGGQIGSKLALLDVLWRLFGHLVALHFFIVFSMAFLIDHGSILLPNLAAKIHQNRSKIAFKLNWQ